MSRMPDRTEPIACAWIWLPASCSISEASRRNFYTTSSCGVCGKASIDAVRVRGIEPPNSECAVDPEVLCRLPDQLRAAQPIFGRTGAIACRWPVQPER